VVYAAGEGKYLPEVAHLTGETRSVREIARIMEEAGAGGLIVLVVVGLRMIMKLLILGKGFGGGYFG
jgi:hypothetical protein